MLRRGNNSRREKVKKRQASGRTGVGLVDVKGLIDKFSLTGEQEEELKKLSANTQKYVGIFSKKDEAEQHEIRRFCKLRDQEIKKANLLKEEVKNLQQELRTSVKKREKSSRRRQEKSSRRSQNELYSIIQEKNQEILKANKNINKYTLEILRSFSFQLDQGSLRQKASIITQGLRDILTAIKFCITNDLNANTLQSPTPVPARNSSGQESQVSRSAPPSRVNRLFGDKKSPSPAAQPDPAETPRSQPGEVSSIELTQMNTEVRGAANTLSPLLKLFERASANKEEAKKEAERKIERILGRIERAREPSEIINLLKPDSKKGEEFRNSISNINLKTISSSIRSPEYYKEHINLFKSKSIRHSFSSFDINYNQFKILVGACQDYIDPQSALDRERAEEKAEKEEEHELQLELATLSSDQDIPNPQEDPFAQTPETASQDFETEADLKALEQALEAERIAAERETKRKADEAAQRAQEEAAEARAADAERAQQEAEAKRIAEQRAAEAQRAQRVAEAKRIAAREAAEAAVRLKRKRAEEAKRKADEEAAAAEQKAREEAAAAQEAAKRLRAARLERKRAEAARIAKGKTGIVRKKVGQDEEEVDKARFEQERKAERKKRRVAAAKRKVQEEARKTESGLTIAVDIGSRSRSLRPEQKIGRPLPDPAPRPKPEPDSSQESPSFAHSLRTPSDNTTDRSDSKHDPSFAHSSRALSSNTTNRSDSKHDHSSQKSPSFSHRLVDRNSSESDNGIFTSPRPVTPPAPGTEPESRPLPGPADVNQTPYLKISSEEAEKTAKEIAQQKLNNKFAVISKNAGKTEVRYIFPNNSQDPQLKNFFSSHNIDINEKNSEAARKLRNSNSIADDQIPIIDLSEKEEINTKFKKELEKEGDKIDNTAISQASGRIEKIEINNKDENLVTIVKYGAIEIHCILNQEFRILASATEINFLTDLFNQNPSPVVKVNDIDKSNELKEAIKKAIKFPNRSPTSPSGASLTAPNQKGVSNS
ncbi:hypothetical protein N9O56_00285 [Rickettsiales bacterium]|nr:hypothetical protein [Rickettsiales bacterium]